MSLSSLSIRRPVTTMMFCIGLVMLGVIAFQNLAIDFLPSIRIPRLTVQTSYPNVAPEEIENAISQPLEAALGTVTGVKKVSSVSREGLSTINVEFYWGSDMDFAVLEVREKLDQQRMLLPRDAGRPTILRVDPSAEPIMIIAVSEKKEKDPQLVTAIASSRSRSGNPSHNPAKIDESTHALVELKETARALIKRRIEQVDGVAQAAVLGGLEREIEVEITSSKIQALGYSLDHVSQALANANLNLPGGTIKRGLFRYSLRTLGEFTNVKEIEEVVIGRTESGRPVTIANVGQVKDGFKERLGLTRYNGQEMIALYVRKEAGANTIEVSRRVHDVLNQLRTEYRQLQLHVIADHAEFISKSITDVQQAIIIGAVLAFLVLFLFLRSPRYPIIIGLTIPISIFATLVVMYFLKINLNIISLTGLALGIGMLGDNAIIVVENVTRLRERGVGLVQAAIEGAQEITLAVTASTLTNVAIFLPIIFVEGVASQLFVDMGVTMTVSLLVSLLMAATLVPMLVSRETSLKLHERSLSKSIQNLKSRPHRFPAKIWFWIFFPLRVAIAFIVMLIVNFMRFIRRKLHGILPGVYESIKSISTRSYDSIDRFLNWSLDHRLLVVTSIVVLFVISVVVALQVPSEPAPDIDQSRFAVHLQMPKGTTLEGTARFVAQVEQTLLSFPEIAGVYSSIGMTEEKNLWIGVDAAIEKADLEIKVRSESETGDVAEKVRTFLTTMQSSYDAVEFSVKRRGTTFEHILRPEPNDIKVRVMGKEPERTYELAREFGERLRGIDGLVDIRSTMQKGSPEYQIVVDRDGASKYALSVQTVAHHLAQHIRGKEATYLSDFDRKIAIRVRPMESEREEFSKVLQSSIVAGGRLIPIREVVRWDRTEGYAEIWREQGQRAVVIVANVSGRSVGSVADEIGEKASLFPLPSGYTISVGGENEDIRESFKSLFIIILLSIFLVYMILAAEYESILYPFVILLTSPLAFIGAILTMAITGQNYNIMSLIGLVIMIGAVDNDAVIVVDVMTDLRRQGLGLREAIREGMRRRLRPILMTTATTVLGIIPLVFEFGTGSELVRALTAPLVGGLIASTVFTVVAIPVVYSYIDRWAMGRKIREAIM
ncbi:MAG: efflux RND transporter permease subunit [Ignavibacteria bacterium]|nr:efflux RND transporter permease subunit [Ignavibacteria bacterium]